MNELKFLKVKPSGTAIFFLILFLILIAADAYLHTFFLTLLAVLGDFIIFLLMFIEERILKRFTKIDIKIDFPSNLVKDEPGTINISIKNKSKKLLHINSYDYITLNKSLFKVEDNKIIAKIPGRSEIKTSYEIKPNQRGELEFVSRFISLKPRFYLLEAWYEIQINHEVIVYISLNELGKKALEIIPKKIYSHGIKKDIKTGKGDDFDHLREYQSTDDYRHIHWKSTAKRLFPITKVYKEEKQFFIIFALDASWLMTWKHENKTKFDAALESILLTSYIALKNGDRVGMIIFANEPVAILPLRGGMNHFNTMINMSSKIFPVISAPDYTQLTKVGKNILKRHGYLFVFTELPDEIQANKLTNALSLLSHHISCFTMNDPMVEDSLKLNITNYQDISIKLAARKINYRQEIISGILKKRKIYHIKSGIGDLSYITLKRYFYLKEKI